MALLKYLSNLCSQEDAGVPGMLGLFKQNGEKGDKVRKTIESVLNKCWSLKSSSILG